MGGERHVWGCEMTGEGSAVIHLLREGKEASKVSGGRRWPRTAILGYKEHKNVFVDS